MGQERNYANQKHRRLEILLYQKKQKIRIITDISTLFEKEEEKEERKKLVKKAWWKIS